MRKALTLFPSRSWRSAKSSPKYRRDKDSLNVGHPFATFWLALFDSLFSSYETSKKSKFSILDRIGGERERREEFGKFEVELLIAINDACLHDRLTRSNVSATTVNPTSHDSILSPSLYLSSKRSLSTRIPLARNFRVHRAAKCLNPNKDK